MAAATTGLPSVYDESRFSAAEFVEALEQVHRATEQDRLWLDEFALPTYETDRDILVAANQGKLERVAVGSGFLAIDRLLKWDISRSDSRHPFHYSPPYLVPVTARLGRYVAGKWQAEMGEGRMLSFTSMVRSNQYQQNLGRKSRKLTINKPGQRSAHQAGMALDIDGCGVIETADDGSLRKINPRFPGFQPGLVQESRQVLKSILQPLHTEGVINMVEELPDTQEHCFHICVNPSADI